jgi:hypothetical protein
MIVNFNSQLGYGLQFAKFVTIGVVVASFHSSGCKLQVPPKYMVVFYN